MKTKPRNRISIVGCCFAAIYIVIGVVVYAATTPPSEGGLDWFPMFIFAMPWYALDRRLLFHGFVANIVLLYLLGAILQRTSRIVGEWESNLRNHVSSWGCGFSAAYLFILIVGFAVIGATTKPMKMGMDFLPLFMLGRSWLGLDAGPLPGFVSNAALLYLLGAILQRISRSVGEWGQPTLKLLIPVLYHADPLVRRFAGNGLRYWPLPQRMEALLRHRRPSDVTADYFSGRQDFSVTEIDELVRVSIPYLRSNDPVILRGAVLMVRRLGLFERSKASAATREKARSALAAAADHVKSKADPQTLADVTGLLTLR